MNNLINRKNIFSSLGVVLFYGIIQALIVTNILPPFYQLTLILMCIYALLATSLNMINGITGQFSIGHAGFMAIGAYVSAIMTVNFHMPLIIALLSGAIVSAIAGFLIGLPSLRLYGDYLAIATLGFGEIVRIFFTNLDYVNGASGFTVPSTITWTWTFGALVISLLFMLNYINSTFGRACISVRENEIAAGTMGINTTKYKVIAFVFGSFFAGLAGAIYANYMFLVQPNTFSFLKTFDILVMVVVGGLGSMTGSIVGAVVMTGVSAALAGIPEWRLVITALIMIIMMLFRPQGLLGTKEFTLSFLGKKDENNVTEIE
ncbi:branched-chain amino acid ABC transporter permease [Candidatus Formimonas warabiya]|uniref:branched-chain amino acid ABC transporter permease n=1 Tax=Formimonas warabiya TaxID=1761012 RepID=UPI0011D1384B|nr:branched-chain amino acid ABC transporter permease [Candidatus Formimonas warabiya]